MTYFRVDDAMWGHPKFMSVSLSAIGLWTRAGSYCGEYLTDGFVPEQMLKFLGESEWESIVDTLVDAGLWKRVEGGIQFWDWDKYQLSKEEVEESRKRWREAKQRYRRGKREQKVESTQVSTQDTSMDSDKDSLVESAMPSGTERNGTERNGSLSKKEDEDLFDEFWSVYPTKHGKAEAKTAWAKIPKSVDRRMVIEKAQAYRDWLKAHPNPPKTKYAQGWLNNRRWDDVLEVERVSSPRSANLHNADRLMAIPGPWQEITA